MADELDARDKALLGNMDAFNREYAATGWHIRDKEIREDLSRVMLVRSSLSSVQFFHVNMELALLTDTRFEGVEFHQVKFTRAVLNGVEFADCRFDMCSFEGAKLTKCRFVRCTAEDLKTREATLEECSFDSYQDDSAVFGNASFHNCRFENARMNNSSFYSGTLNRVFVKQSELKNVVFFDIKGSELSFEEVTMFNCGFEESEYGEVTIGGGRSKGVTFYSFNPKKVTIRNCAAAEVLTIRESTWEDSAITGIHELRELTINECHMSDMTMEDNKIARLEMEDTEVSGGSRIANCSIAGLSLQRSKLTGSRMENCSLASYLLLDGATLDAVVLQGIGYAPGMDITAEGVQYLNGSARFGGA